MSRESHLELKVGGFVFLALIGLSLFVLSVTDLSFTEKGRPMQMIFNFANGLKEAAPVRLAGVEAGLVKHIKVFVDTEEGKKTKVKVGVWLKEGIVIPMDSTVTINQLGLLGEKYIEIIPGRSTDFFAENSSIIGKDPISVDKITEQVSHITEKLDVTLSDVNEILNSIKKGQGTVGKLLMDDSIYKNLDELTVDLKTNPWKLLYRPKQK
jgi:phospholipid/cholesterol/gamma-HCH transport system substrate-binding protein